MTNPLTMKLEQFTRFDQAERLRLDELLAYPTKTYAAREVIIEEGEKVDNIHLVLTGLAARAKTLRDGGRQIMAFLVPGDLCDVEVFVLRAMDHEITAVSETTCVLIPARIVESLLTEGSNITRAIWWSTMTDSAVLRELILDHGRRDAQEHLAHLFYELLIRFRMVGQTTDNSMPFPLTQQELADATGMTPVHVNRSLQQLRSEGLIELRGKVLTILDPPGLMKAAKFEADYLHLARTERRDAEVYQRVGDLVLPEHEGLVHQVVRTVKERLGQ